MEMIPWVALLICLIGLIGYVVSNHAKIQAICLDCFWVGLLAFLLEWGGAIPHR